MELLIPRITTEISGEVQQLDPVSLELARRRRVWLGEVNDLTAMSVIAQLEELDARAQEPITLVINSPGGSVTAGLAIYDCLRRLRSPVITAATGMAASMGAFLLAAGTPGLRFATEHTEVMIHQPMGGVQGQATDICLMADRIREQRRRLAVLLAQNCGKNGEQVLRDTERDHWMTPEKALRYGLIDHIGFPDAETGVQEHA